MDLVAVMNLVKELDRVQGKTLVKDKELALVMDVVLMMTHALDKHKLFMSCRMLLLGAA